MKKNKKTIHNKRHEMLSKFSRVVWILSILLIIILGYFIYSANVLPVKYFMIIVGVFALFLAIHGFFVIKKNTRTWILIVLNILTLLFMCGEVFAITKISDTINFLRKNLSGYVKTDVYNILVNKNSSYQNLSDLEGKTFQTVKDMDDVELFESMVKKKMDGTIVYEEDGNIVDLLTKVKTDNEIVLIVNAGSYEAMLAVDETFEESVRIIDTITITTEVQNINQGKDLTKEAFVVYLSGIDTRSGYLPSRSLSDVNILLAVNPKTKRILMIHIPRDYYVQVHGTTGYKDKLTHTGTIGGVELTMKTLEDLLEIELPYYIRVNFNSVIRLVDAIGGINIHSDVDYSFTCWTDRGCSFHPGLNSVDGRCALAFARERKAYATGDRHRGENQEQVLELVINKVTSSSTLISNYTEILDALNGTFQTNLSMDDITNLVKMQIDDMSPWKIESLNVDGKGGMLPTYSYPRQKLYVMEPNMETVKKAIQKLNEVLETP